MIIECQKPNAIDLTTSYILVVLGNTVVLRMSFEAIWLVLISRYGDADGLACTARGEDAKLSVVNTSGDNSRAPAYIINWPNEDRDNPRFYH